MTSELDSESLALLQLNLTPGIGPRLQSVLLERFGNAGEIFSASTTELLAVDGIGPKVSAALRERGDFSEARQEWENCRQRNIAILFPHQAEYPRALLEIPDPPPALYVQSQLVPGDELAVAIVGSRQCSHYGRTVAHQLAGQLARAGITVVSGLARGIDAAAHQGALEAGGRTLAVCAQGLSQIYPPEHDRLAEEVIGCGALVTESPLGRTALRGLFPQRNRIIAGLSLGVIIVEATRKSGALHTARHAVEQGREVFAVPGRIDTFFSTGCHDLIRDGATLVRSIEDVLEALPPAIRPVVATGTQRPVATPRELNLNEFERKILDLIDFRAVPVDSILAQADCEVSRVLSTLTVLEMKRLVRRLPGGNIERITG